MKKLQTLAFAALLAATAAAGALAQTGTLTAAPPNFPGDTSGDTAAVGTKGPGSSQTYMDVEGSGPSNGAKYETFGVIDFTGVSGQPTVTDTSGNSEIVGAIAPNITLDLFDSPYSATNPGVLDFYLTDNNAALSGLTYQTSSPNGIGSQLNDLFFLGAGAYTSTSGSLTGADYTYDLTLPNQAAQNYMLQQLNDGGNIRLLVAADNSAGSPNSNIVGSFYGAGSADPPELTLTVAVPEANTPALLGLGLLGLGALGVARRRTA